MHHYAETSLRKATPNGPHPKQQPALTTYPNAFGCATRGAGPIARMKKVGPLAHPRLADMRTLADIWSNGKSTYCKDREMGEGRGIYCATMVTKHTINQERFVIKKIGS